MPPLLQLIRPGQWIKALFVLVAPFFDGSLLDGPLALDMMLLVMSFSLAASSIYALNDVSDSKLDLHHPSKRHRPVASGTIPTRTASQVSALCALLAIVASGGAGPQIVPITIGYLVVGHTYSLGLKHIPYLDVLMIATGFLLRVASGAQLTRVANFSPWLYLCVFLLALLLILGKRRSELVDLGKNAVAHRPSLRGFSLPVITITIWLCGLALASLYAGYALTATTRVVSNPWMGVTVIPVWWGIGYYMKLVLIHNKGSDPSTLLWEKPLLTVILLIYAGLTSFLIYTSLPGG